jgi:CelD/BcsL family acetyltransferase involved in cellulose biosynthesis
MTLNTPHVHVISGPEAIETLRSEWQELFHQAAASPFLSWEWAAAWQRWLGQHRRPRLYCVRAGRSLIALLPLSEEQRRAPWLPLPIKRLGFHGEGFGGADYLDLIALPGHRRAALSAILERLTREADFDVLELDSLSADSATTFWLTQHFSAAGRFTHRVTPRHICPLITLEEGWPAVLKRSRRGDNFRRYLKKLRALPGFEFRVITEPAEALSAFERFLRLHEDRWAERGDSELTGHASLKAFQREVVEQLSRAGLLRFKELWAEGECRATVYGFEHKETFYDYNAGFDPAWSRFSVGSVLLGLSIEEAVSRGLKYYDLLRGEEAYKFEWANTQRSTLAVQIARRRLPSAVYLAQTELQAQARQLARRVLPGTAAEQLRRTVRAWKRNALPGSS